MNKLKPRFGKTLSAYDLCKQLDAKTVLIVTHRPAIATSWYSDYEKFLGTQSGYYFISQADALKDKPSVVKRENLPASARKYIEFVSLQDLKGAIEFGGKYDKLNHISKLKWDLLIIDEAHEGIDTYRADVALDNIHRKYTLHLSGTPFKALANAKFESEAIYNWTYADEQKAKNEWNPSNEEENPYATLPKLNLYTYQMSSIIADKLKQGADFNDDGEYEKSEEEYSDEIKTKFFNEYLDMINSISSCTLYDYLEFENTYYNSSVIGDIVNDYLNGDISKEKFIRQLSAATEIYLTE